MTRRRRIDATRVRHHDTTKKRRRSGSGTIALLEKSAINLGYVAGKNSLTPATTGRLMSPVRWKKYRCAGRAGKDSAPRSTGPQPLLIDGELGIKGGWESGRRIAAQVKRGGIDGIFVVNDLTAVGVVNALLAGGVRIPADVSLVACDNLPFIDSLPVRLATVDIGLGRCHEEAVSQLLQTVRNGSRIHIPVRPRLQEGESVMRRR